MKISVLVGSNPVTNESECGQVMSLHIQTEKHSILFDLGKDRLFLDNAAKLGIDISKVDMVVISHGYSDHGRALECLFEENHTAKIYIQKETFGPYYTQLFRKLNYCYGTDYGPGDYDRITFVDRYQRLDDCVELFAEPEGRRQTARMAHTRNEPWRRPEDFRHEMSMVMREEGRSYLFTGTYSKGILNVLDAMERKCQRTMDYVIGGFHLFDPGNGKYEQQAAISHAATRLGSEKTMLYACRCAGEKAFNILKESVQGHADYIAAGQVLTV